MWKLLEQAAKTAKEATANAAEYASTVQVKAQSIVATVQDEAATLLHAIGTARTGPVDELLYEEIEDYKVFTETFNIDDHTAEISTILGDDDEIRELHEQMVPVQLSYEEFWCRYFFRRQAEQLRQQQEVARRQRQLEQEEARVAAKMVLLEEFDVDEDDEIDEGDVDIYEATAPELTVDGGETHGDTSTDAVSTTATSTDVVELRRMEKEARVCRKAAIQWKQKAQEYQQQLKSLAEEHEIERARLQQTMEEQYQSLCDTYETKMTEITMQIDEARAAGYDAGIQESESIVAAMRQETEDEKCRLKSELNQNGQTPDATPESTGEEALSHLKNAKNEIEHALAEKCIELESALAQIAILKSHELPGSVDSLQEELVRLQSELNSRASLQTQLKLELERLLNENSSLQQQLDQSLVTNKELHQQIATLNATSQPTQSLGAKEVCQLEQGLAEARKELEMWRIRAIKMKKLKEQVDQENQQLKEQQTTCPPPPQGSEIEAMRKQIAALSEEKEQLASRLDDAYTKGAEEASHRSEAAIKELQSQLSDVQEHLRTVESDAFNRGLEEGRHEATVSLQKAQDESSATEMLIATASLKEENKQLRLELSDLRNKLSSNTILTPFQDVSSPATGDVLAQADAVLSSLSSPTAILGDNASDLGNSWDTASAASIDVVAPKDDWGEW